MGGTRNPAIHHPSNLVVLCRACHQWIELNRRVATEQGWLISKNDPRSASSVPVYAFGAWYLLDAVWHAYEHSIPF